MSDPINPDHPENVSQDAVYEHVVRRLWHYALECHKNGAISDAVRIQRFAKEFAAPLDISREPSKDANGHDLQPNRATD